MSNLRAELQRHSPFRQMSAGDVDAFVLAARQTYYAPGEVILSPGQGPVGRLLCLRRGNVSGGPESADAAGSGFLLEAGDLFPVAAWLGQRPVSAPYTAADDCFCLEVPAEAMRALAQRSGALADFLNGRVQRFLTLSKQALKSTFASQALAEQSMEARLGSLQRRTLVACSPQTPVIDVLRLMQQRRVGSVLMLDPSGVVQGILTRHDVLERVALGQPPMDTPVSRLMSHPVHTLDVESQCAGRGAADVATRHPARAGDRARARGQHGVRARPVRAAAAVAEAPERYAAQCAGPARPW